jgi:hypothetical protein
MSMSPEEASNPFSTQIASTKSFSIGGMNLWICVEGSNPLDITHHQHFLRQDIGEIREGRRSVVVRFSMSSIVAVFHVVPRQEWFQAKRLGVTWSVKHLAKHVFFGFDEGFRFGFNSVSMGLALTLMPFEEK